MKWLVVYLCLVASAASAGFTYPADGLDIQDATNCLNELRLSICERLAAQRTGESLGRGEAWGTNNYDTGYVVTKDGHLWAATKFLNSVPWDADDWMKDEVASGTDIQAASFWSEMQTFVFNPGTPSSMSEDTWIDPSTVMTNENSLDYIDTWAEMGVLADISTNGFRRISASYPADWDGTNGIAWSYGLCQAGDYIGPWLIYDMQAVMGVQTKLAAGDGSNTSVSNRNATSAPASTNCASELSDHDTAWAAASWTSGSGAWLAKYDQGVLSGNYTFVSDRRAGAPRFSNVSTVATSTGVVFALVGFANWDEFYDVDSLGMTTNTYFEVENLGGGAGATRTGAVFGQYSGAPVTLRGISCPVTNSLDGGWYFATTDTEWTFDWAFTH